ncbi:hypothetical protein R3W88_031656 [Solanum pinnatisectum]|uniref:Uncharacterized protein n=1 Tax=Solanum pinnatisectum TaxID=50273 RepID=A0AAV9LQF9_9SOLN|nr:hypothetical protein R3W88_031656 [Solanum pinnatisectum]
MQARLSGWKTRFLNTVGRTTLAKTCLSSLPTHTMQFTKLPKHISNRIDQI